MGKTTCCEQTGLKKGPWAAEEDIKLIDYIQKHGYGRWRTLPKNAGLQRCGKSCRLRWTNYLRPDIKRGKFSREEEDNIIHLHSLLGNKWSAIAARLPGRTDNEIKNYWNTHIRKRLLRIGIDPLNHATNVDTFRHLSPVSSSSSSSQHSFNHLPMAYSQEHQTTCFPKLSTLLSSLSPTTPYLLPIPLLQINEDVHESVQYSKSAIVDPFDLYQQEQLSGSSYAMFSSPPSSQFGGGDGYSNLMVDLDFNFYGGWKACS